MDAIKIVAVTVTEVIPVSSINWRFKTPMFVGLPVTNISSAKVIFSKDWKP